MEGKRAYVVKAGVQIEMLAEEAERVAHILTSILRGEPLNYSTEHTLIQLREVIQVGNDDD